MTKIEEREKAIRKIWAANALMQVLKLEIEEIREGKATLSMPIDFEIHTNHWLGVHGGALATLADSACGIACASVGKIAQTLNMNINYISNTRSMNRVFATAEIVHDGQSTINLRVKISDDVDTLMCDASAVYFVSGNLDDMKV
ncbi:MAG: PaaI family thioesterase [Acidaminococcaceae bacterium]|nr:PaaI family thioesterase [Acidaminococcaceae bacterium]MBO5636075.1 PaaI family thioesterase [Acidaminococcaceae bacterium]